MYSSVWMGGVHAITEHVGAPLGMGAQSVVCRLGCPRSSSRSVLPLPREGRRGHLGTQVHPRLHPQFDLDDMKSVRLRCGLRHHWGFHMHGQHALTTDHVARPGPSGVRAAAGARLGCDAWAGSASGPRKAARAHVVSGRSAQHDEGDATDHVFDGLDLGSGG